MDICQLQLIYLFLPVLYVTDICKINRSINTNNYNSIVCICFRILFNISINCCPWQSTQNSCSTPQTIVLRNQHILHHVYLSIFMHLNKHIYTLAHYILKSMRNSVRKNREISLITFFYLT